MKNQQVVPDYAVMVKSSCLCLLLAFSGYVLLKLLQAVFYLPRHLQRNQEKLEELAAKYAINLNDKQDSAGDPLANIQEASGDEVDGDRKKEL